MAKIPKHIRDKLRRIMNHQIAVKQLVSQVEEWAGIADVFDDEVWNWSMNVDEQGTICTTDSAESLLRRYIALKEARK